MKNLRDIDIDIDKIWDYECNYPLKPEDVSSRSNKKYFWKCLKGHSSYLCSPDKKYYGGCGCPVCSNHKVIKGINDFESNNQELMKDWNYSLNKDVDPSMLSIKSKYRVSWKCHKCGFEWEGTISDAVDKSINCPNCSKFASGIKKHNTALANNGVFNDKILLLDWDYNKNLNLPSEYTKHSSRSVFWKCHKCGYEWKSKINNRSNGRGCPCCSHKVVVKGVNDLATINPSLAKEWHPSKNYPLMPFDVLPSINKKVWWLCPNGHEYQSTINHRSSTNGTNCPICFRGNQTSFREQALYYYIKKEYPNAISGYRSSKLSSFELDIYIPDLKIGIEYDGVAWHKEENFEREKRKYEACKKEGIYLIRVKEKFPEKWWADIADTMISGHSEKDFESLEEYSKIIHLVLEKIVSPFRLYWINPLNIDLNRDRFEILKNYTEIKNSFEDIYPDIAKEWDEEKNLGLTPKMFRPKSDFKAWWKCSKCCNVFEATIGRRANGTGCPKCGIIKSTIAKSRKVAMIDINTGMVIKIFDSISEAGRETNNSTGNIVAVCKGKRTNAGGYIWKYYGDMV